MKTGSLVVLKILFSIFFFFRCTIKTCEKGLTGKKRNLFKESRFVRIFVLFCLTLVLK